MHPTRSGLVFDVIIGRGRGPSPTRTIVVVVSMVALGLVLVLSTRKGSVGDFIGGGMLAGSLSLAFDGVRHHRREARERLGKPGRFPEWRPDEAYCRQLQRS
jgi:hypothetical protein